MIDAKVSFTMGSFSLNSALTSSGFIGLGGGNGSGKTTFLKVLAGAYLHEDGYIRINGKDVGHLPLSERRIMYLNSDTYFGHVNVMRHLLWGVPEERRGETASQLNAIADPLGIAFTGRVSRLSLGQRSRVILGTALLARPDVVLIDELFANISGRQEIISYIKRFSSDNGIDVVTVLQDEADLPYMDHFFVMENGHILERR